MDMARQAGKTMGLIKLILAAAAIVSQGCGSNIRATGPDARANYGWGTLKATLEYPIGATHEAAKKALEELNVTVLQDEQDDLAGELLARDAQDDLITIKLEVLPRSRTRMTIRIGTLGDKNKSNVVFNEVMENLR